MYSPVISKETACIILAGGISQRMGAHKALLPYLNGENFLQHIIRIYHEAGIYKIVVVLNAKIDLPANKANQGEIKIIKNSFTEKGRIYSLQLGLAAENKLSYCFIQNIDNPFVTKKIIYDLYKSREKADYVCPVFANRGGHPIIISSKIIEHVLNLRTYESTLREVLAKFNRFDIDADEKCLLNINSPAEYKLHFG